MTKRYGNFEPQSIKKPKLDNDIEALWGDDLDENAVEDCIKLATQVCEEERITCTQLNNVTLLPTYSAFKERSTIISSTQVFNSIRPSTSRNDETAKLKNVDGCSEKEINLLRQKYEEKEGEVAVLRAQIQKIKSNIQSEQQRTQNEWRQKLSTIERQTKSIKSELEFKNLEIANLKQTVLDVTKRNNLKGTTEISTNQNVMADKCVILDVKPELPKIKIQSILHPVYPLKGIIGNSVFNIPKQQQYVIEKKLTHPCRNAIPYLQNRKICATIAVDNSDIRINSVYPEILNLTYCTEEELKSDQRNDSVNKIICTCEQSLEDLQQFLNQIKNNLRTEDILEADTNYLKCQNGETLPLEKAEIGLKSAVLLNFLGKIFPYNDYLKEYICHNSELILQDKESYTKIFPYLDNLRQKYGQYYFLNTILNILRTTGEIRKAMDMSSFICATLQLLINIAKTGKFDYVSDIFCKLTKEIILSRPSVKVICGITLLFKVASQHSLFIDFLFNKSTSSISSKKGILYFNEDACRFYIFVMLFDNSIFKLNCEHFSVDVCLNMLCFIYNTFQTSSWIHHRNAKECECVPQLYKLEIEIVFKALEIYIAERKSKNKNSDWEHFFKNPITVKVLSLMTFNSCELTEKYITVFSQYKEIEKILQEEKLIELEKLNISEEIVEVPSSAFAKIDF